MNNEVEYLFEEQNRLILLLRGCDHLSQNKDQYLDDLQKNTSELKRLWKQKKETRNERENLEVD